MKCSEIKERGSNSSDILVVVSSPSLEKSNHRHPYLKAKTDQLSDPYKSREHILPSFTKSQLNMTTSVLKLLHMDLIDTRVSESIDRKRFIYAKVVHTICLYLGHSYQRDRTLKTPYVIRKGVSIQVRIMPSNEREPFFSVGGLKNFFISTPF